MEAKPYHGDRLNRAAEVRYPYSFQILAYVMLTDHLDTWPCPSTRRSPSPQRVRLSKTRISFIGSRRNAEYRGLFNEVPLLYFPLFVMILLERV
jgi:hypothetical protein